MKYELDVQQQKYYNEVQQFERKFETLSNELVQQQQKNQSLNEQMNQLKSEKHAGDLELLKLRDLLKYNRNNDAQSTYYRADVQYRTGSQSPDFSSKRQEPQFEDPLLQSFNPNKQQSQEPSDLDLDKNMTKIQQVMQNEAFGEIRGLINSYKRDRDQLKDNSLPQRKLFEPTDKIKNAFNLGTDTR